VKVKFTDDGMMNDCRAAMRLMDVVAGPQRAESCAGLTKLK